MRYRAASRLCVTVSALICAGCLSLPSVVTVEDAFRRQHPNADVLEVSCRMYPNTATFQVLYREPANPKLFSYERGFGLVAEGWLEGPSRTQEVQVPP
jgi:hypothetical protein